MVEIQEYTYPQAAQALNTTVNTIKKAITLGNLHPIKHPGDRNKYLSAKEIEGYRGKSILTIATRRKENATADSPNQSPNAQVDNTVANERLVIVIKFIEALFAGLTSEAGKVSTHLISAALGSSRFAETMKVVEDFANLAQAKQGATPQDIGAFIQLMDAATSKDLGIETEAPVDMKVRAATILAQEAQRQNVLLSA